jgi:hypothetical protein
MLNLRNQPGCCSPARISHTTLCEFAGRSILSQYSSVNTHRSPDTLNSLLRIVDECDKDDERDKFKSSCQP